MLRYETEGAIGVITLAGPGYNVLQDPEFADLDELRRFFETPHLKAAIIRGEGRHFSAGADPETLKEQVGARGYPLREKLQTGKTLIDEISYAPIPTLALIRGSCLGAGLEIALACHFRFAAKNALLGFPEVELRLMPGLGGTVIAPRVMPFPRAADLILSGRLIRAEEAVEMGLVDQIGGASEITKMAEDYLDRLTRGRSTELIHAVMEAIHNSRRLDRKDAFQRETELFAHLAELRRTD